MVEEDPPLGVPEWVVTFGDMMSLLLTFFIMLVSMSEVKKEEQYQAMVESIRQQFGYEKSINALIPGVGKPRNSHVDKLATMGRAMRFNTMKGGDKVKAPVGDHPRVTIIREGNKTAVGTAILFDDAQGADLSNDNRRTLDQQLGQLAGKAQKIEIRGHTSRRPPDRNFRDNWDLAYARCRSTAAYLIEKGIEPERLRLFVAGEHDPLHLETLDGNGRVEVLLSDDVIRLEPAQPPSAS
jgi:chemotaxis protein MotB